MSQNTLTEDDEALVEEARRVVTENYVHSRHYVGSAVRTKSGDVYSAVHIEANVGRASVCAEPIALGTAVSDGAHDIDVIASVRHPGPDEGDEIPVVSPCGVCRELISDLDEDITVIYDHDGEVKKTRAVDLLPGKYVKSYRKTHLE
ncbi:cytidine deaminase [Halogranum rubrum]|uniref:Cytidine deaminase n=1 Tax=Halogranum rubrum TaxID=553466 RepID=A0A1I4E2H3_9EURY|nr:cytidine deaminase [Halogranum rubrum]SFK99962.1 cytidine deaminase [Halogranum rubrum]